MYACIVSCSLSDLHTYICTTLGTSSRSIYYVLGQQNGPPGKFPTGWDITLRGRHSVLMYRVLYVCMLMYVCMYVCMYAYVCTMIKDDVYV